MEKYEKMLHEINSKLHEIDKTLALNTQHLEAHMKRTTQIEDELMPVVKHVQQVQGAGKLIALLALIATILIIFKP